MQNTIEQRKKWLEIRFYFLCADILNKTKELQNTQNFFKYINIFNDYDDEIIKTLVAHMLLDNKYTPIFIECCFLAAKLGVPPYFLAKRFHVKVWHVRNNMQKILALHKLEGVKTMPLLPYNTHIQIENVFNTLKKIEKIGKQYNVKSGTKK